MMRDFLFVQTKRDAAKASLYFFIPRILEEPWIQRNLPYQA